MTAHPTVEMLPGDHPLIRFPMAFVTRTTSEGATINQQFGKINVSVETMEEAKQLRDALSAFITFHEKVGAAT